MTTRPSRPSSLRSGELARLAEVSTDTLRHYERLGLLAEPPRTASGYRCYPASALDRVRAIRAALAIGFSLAELRSILSERDGGGRPCRRVRALAAEKLAMVDERLREIAALRDRLSSILDEWDERLATTNGQTARLLDSLSSDSTERT